MRHNLSPRLRKHALRSVCATDCDFEVRLALSSRRTFVLAAVLAACATDSSGPPTPVETVEIAVPAPLAVGSAIQLQVTLHDADGAQLTGRTITWSTSDPAVATVSGAGMVSGLTLGSATITATI